MDEEDELFSSQIELVGAAFGLVGISALAAAVMVGSLPVLILTCIQTGVLALLAWKCLKLSEGHQLSSGKVTWQGTIGEKVGLGIRIALFALAAQLLAGTVALSGIADTGSHLPLLSLHFYKLAPLSLFQNDLLMSYYFYIF